MSEPRVSPGPLGRIVMLAAPVVLVALGFAVPAGMLAPTTFLFGGALCLLAVYAALAVPMLRDGVPVKKIVLGLGAMIVGSAVVWVLVKLWFGVVFR